MQGPNVSPDTRWRHSFVSYMPISGCISPNHSPPMTVVTQACMHACMHAWPLGALITARIERSSIFCHATVAAAVVRTGYSIQNRKAEQLSFPSRYAKPAAQPVWLNSWQLGAGQIPLYKSCIVTIHMYSQIRSSLNRH